jgi:hypothetical protein
LLLLLLLLQQQLHLVLPVLVLLPLVLQQLCRL